VEDDDDDDDQQQQQQQQWKLFIRYGENTDCLLYISFISIYVII